MLPANLVLQMIRDGELEEVAGNSLVAEDRPWVFYRGANVKVFACRVVRRNEIETARVFVVNAGCVHEAAGTGWLKRLRQLANFKPAQVRRQRDKMIRIKKSNHLHLAALICFQKNFLTLQH